MIKAGIINVTGYAGMELARILSRHPNVEVTSVTGRSSVGKHLPDLLPHLTSMNLTITEYVEESVDIVFSALPSGASASTIAPLIENGIRTIDIASDFRLTNPSEFKRAYQITHPAPHLLQNVVYGLPEIHKSEVKEAQLVANPGCFPTAAILALAPAIKSKLITDDIIVDAKTGISGAGRGGLETKTVNHFAEANENTFAYGLDGHAHQPEITQELETLQKNSNLEITFVPHRIPMTRGILATCYGVLNTNRISNKEINGIYREFYKSEPFVNVISSSPQTKQTLGSNVCLIYPMIDTRTRRLIIISCIDNLVKGAAGQAIQNMNLMFQFEETDGLQQLPLYP